jgi:hypothetical protein
MVPYEASQQDMGCGLRILDRTARAIDWQVIERQGDILRVRAPDSGRQKTDKRDGSDGEEANYGHALWLPDLVVRPCRAFARLEKSRPVPPAAL